MTDLPDYILHPANLSAEMVMIACWLRITGEFDADTSYALIHSAAGPGFTEAAADQIHQQLIDAEDLIISPARDALRRYYGYEQPHMCTDWDTVANNLAFTLRAEAREAAEQMCARSVAA